jgi:L-amino acid N-acyltransferase YncA
MPSDLNEPELVPTVFHTCNTLHNRMILDNRGIAKQLRKCLPKLDAARSKAMADDQLSAHLLASYPRVVKLQDGTTLTIRFLIPQDRASIGAFFERVPEEDRAFLKEDLLNREEVEIWLDTIDIERESVMVAVHGNRIVATAVLERQRHGWARHVGEIRIVIDPEFRRRGLGYLLAETIFELAQHAGLEKLMAQMVADHPGPIRVFKHLGFRTEATLNDHVKDRHGNKHDLLLMANYMTEAQSARVPAR